jgi:hypothetical protein
MVSSGLLRRVALVRTDVWEEPGASSIRVTKIGALGTTQAATSNRRTLRRNTKGSYIPEDGILYSHRRENLNSYLVTSVMVLSYACHSQIHMLVQSRWNSRTIYANSLRLVTIPNKPDMERWVFSQANGDKSINIFRKKMRGGRLKGTNVITYVNRYSSSCTLFYPLCNYCFTLQDVNSSFWKQIKKSLEWSHQKLVRGCTPYRPERSTVSI